MNSKSHLELVKQIEAYGLKSKLKALAKKDEQRRPFRHLPKQFSKGILIGNIAIVPRKAEGTRYIYVIADMVNAQILYKEINLKQTAILIAHNLADGRSAPHHIIDTDQRFASQLFDITNAKRMWKMAVKQRNEIQVDVYQQKLESANALADQHKNHIMDEFRRTFSN
jgi:hypothetical protein